MPDQPAPANLSAAGTALWAAMTKHMDFRPDELAVLEQAARIADTIATLEAELSPASATVAGSRGQDTVNPLIPELRLQRQALVTFLGRLDVPEPADPDALTPSQRGRRAARARWDRRGATPQPRAV
jgi:hypothetical protein